MQKYISKLFWLNIGFFLCALGVAFILSSQTGYGPWDVLASGISLTLGITIGRAMILISIALVIFEYFVGSSIGVGTLLNMIMIGLYIDFINSLHIISPGENYAVRILFLFIGMVILNFGIWLYMAQGLGSGPRDGLMVVFAKKFKLSVGVMKLINESVAFIIGYLLGGFFGVGTVLIALFSGPLLNFQFKMLKFDAKSVQHEYITDYFKKKSAA